MTNKSEAIAAKIKALFAKVRDEATTEAERNAAEAKANELIVKYAIEESMLTETEQAELVQETMWIVGGSGPRVARQRSLIATVAQAHGCYMFYMSDCYRKADNAKGAWDFVTDSKGRYVKHTKVTITGRPGSVAGSIALASSLLTVALAGASNVTIDEDHPDYFPWDSKAANTKRARNAYLEGFILAVQARLAELNRKPRADIGGSMHPILMSDAKRAEAHAKSEHDITRGGGFGRSSSASARAAGTAAGNSANLASRSVSTRKAIGR